MPPTQLSTNAMSHACFTPQPHSIAALPQLVISYPLRIKGWVGMGGGWLFMYQGDLPTQKTVIQPSNNHAQCTVTMLLLCQTTIKVRDTITAEVNVKPFRLVYQCWLLLEHCSHPPETKFSLCFQACAICSLTPLSRPSVSRFLPPVASFHLPH